MSVFLWLLLASTVSMSGDLIVADMTPSIVIFEAYEAPIQEVIPPRYGFTEDEVVLLARLLCGDSRVDGDGEYDFDFGLQDRDDQIGLVLCVVMNRVRSDLYPNTVADVIFQPGQFSPVSDWKGSPNVSDIAIFKVQQWCYGYDTYDPSIQVIPTDHLYFTGDGRKNHSR